MQNLTPDPKYAHLKDYPFIPDTETIHLIETELLRITRSVYDAAIKLIHFIKEEGKDLGIHDFPLEELQERRYPIHNDVITIVDQYTVVQNLEDYFKFQDWHEQLINFNENGWLEDGVIYDGVNYLIFDNYEINCHCYYETSANLVGANAVMTTVEGYILLFVYYEDEVIYNAFGLKGYRQNK